MSYKAQCELLAAQHVMLYDCWRFLALIIAFGLIEEGNSPVIVPTVCHSLAGANSTVTTALVWFMKLKYSWTAMWATYSHNR